MKHIWETIVDDGPTRVHWCKRCGRVVVNIMEKWEEGDYEYQTGKIVRQPEISVACPLRVA